jgi:long-chain acyl-CoA synthetase
MIELFFGGAILKPYPYYRTREVTCLNDLLAYRVRNTPEKDAFRIRVDKDSYRAVSWRRFDEDVRCLGTELLALGFGGKHICVVGENAYEWVLAYFAAIVGGMVAAPLDREQPPARLAEMVRFSDASAVVFSKTCLGAAEQVKAACPDVRFVCMSEGTAYGSLDSLIQKGRERRDNGDDSFDRVEVDLEKMAALYFTSGTSGLPKGVMLSQKNLAASFDGACKHVLFTDDDVVLSVLPLHHAYESNCGILALMHSGSVICFNENLKLFLGNLKLFRPTGISLVPLVADTLFRQIMNTAQKNGKLKKLKTGMRISDFLLRFNIDITDMLFGEVYEALGGRYRKSFVGGAPMNPVVTKAFRQLGITMLQGYGITECSPLVSVNRENFYKDDSVGPVLPVCRVRIVDGEVLVKGDNVMLGYYKDPRATTEAMEGGWFRTGDLGYIDMSGFLYITGRKKNLIILESGENISPEELEGYLINLPLVGEVVVLERDGRITAEIFPDAEYAAENAIEDIRAALLEQISDINKGLPRYKHILGLRLRDREFEKNSSRKIIRYDVKSTAPPLSAGY